MRLKFAGHSFRLKAHCPNALSPGLTLESDTDLTVQQHAQLKRLLQLYLDKTGFEHDASSNLRDEDAVGFADSPRQISIPLFAMLPNHECSRRLASVAFHRAVDLFSIVAPALAQENESLEYSAAAISHKITSMTTQKKLLPLRKITEWNEKNPEEKLEIPLHSLREGARELMNEPEQSNLWRLHHTMQVELEDLSDDITIKDTNQLAKLLAVKLDDFVSQNVGCSKSDVNRHIRGLLRERLSLPEQDARLSSICNTIADCAIAHQSLGR